MFVERVGDMGEHTLVHVSRGRVLDLLFFLTQQPADIVEVGCIEGRLGLGTHRGSTSCSDAPSL